MKRKCQKNVSENGCQLWTFSDHLKVIVKMKPFDKYVKCWSERNVCVFASAKFESTISWWNIDFWWETDDFWQGLNNRINKLVIIIAPYPNKKTTLQNQNWPRKRVCCMFNCWLSSFSITEFWNLTRVSLLYLTPSNGRNCTFI